MVIILFCFVNISFPGQKQYSGRKTIFRTENNIPHGK